MKITCLKLSATAAAQLAGLGLSLADLGCILHFARRTRLSEAQIYHFDIERVPQEVRAELQHLAGVELQIVSGAIVSASRLLLNETGDGTQVREGKR